MLEEVQEPLLKAYAALCPPLSDATYVLDPMTRLTLPPPALVPLQGSNFGFANPFADPFLCGAKAKGPQPEAGPADFKATDSIVTPDGATLWISDP